MSNYPLVPLILLTLAACDADRAPGVRDVGEPKSVTATGSAEGATSVSAHSYDTGGAAEVLATGEVSSDGSFTLDLPAEVDGVVIEATDAEGALVASALLVTTGSAEGAISLPSMDEETWLEAEVYAHLAAEGEAVDAGALRTRVDGTLDAEVEAIADAVLAAEHVEAEAWAEADADVVAAARADAWATYDAAVAAGADAEAEFSALVQASAVILADAGESADSAWQAEAQAGLALRLVAEAEGASSATIDALAEASGQVEAWFAGDAAIEAAIAAESEAAVSAATSAAAELYADASAGATSRAFAEFESDLAGDGGVISLAVASDGSAEAVSEVEAALDAALETAEALDASVSATLTAQAEAGAAAEESAETVTEAWSAFVASVHAEGVSRFESEAAADLLVVATGSFR